MVQNLVNADLSAFLSNATLHDAELQSRLKMLNLTRSKLLGMRT